MDLRRQSLVRCARVIVRPVVSASLLVAVLAGTAVGQTAGGSGVVEGRPVIARSSAEAHASTLPDPAKVDMQAVLSGLGASQLEFFDDVERQSLVCHDDALHACLLMGAGINAGTYEQRKEMAAKLGWISPVFDRPAREAITIGETCRMMARMMGGAETISQEEAVAMVARVRGLPEHLKPYQGITGSQLLSVLGAVHDSVTPAHGAAKGAQPMVSSPVVSPPQVEVKNVSMPAETARVEKHAAVKSSASATTTPITTNTSTTTSSPTQIEVIPESGASLPSAEGHGKPEHVIEPVIELTPPSAGKHDDVGSHVGNGKVEELTPITAHEPVAQPMEAQQVSPSIVITTVAPGEAPANEPVEPEIVAATEMNETQMPAPEAEMVPQVAVQAEAPMPQSAVVAPTAQAHEEVTNAATAASTPSAQPARAVRPAQFRPGTPVKKPGGR